MQNCTSIKSLPCEVLVKIFYFVGAQHTGTLAAVCKVWKTLIDDPQLWRQHYADHYHHQPRTEEISARDAFQLAHGWVSSISSCHVKPIEQRRALPLKGHKSACVTTVKLYAGARTPAIVLIRQPGQFEMVSPALAYDRASTWLLYQKGDHDPVPIIRMFGASNARLLLCQRTYNDDVFLVTWDPGRLELYRVAGQSQGPLDSFWPTKQQHAYTAILHANDTCLALVATSDRIFLYQINKDNTFCRKASFTFNYQGSHIREVCLSKQKESSYLIVSDVPSTATGSSSMLYGYALSNEQSDPVWTRRTWTPTQRRWIGRRPGCQLPLLQRADSTLVNVPCYNRARDQFLSFDEHGTLWLFDPKTGEKSLSLKSQCPPRELCFFFSTSNDRCLMGLDGGRPVAWSLESGKRLGRMNIKNVMRMTILEGPDGPYVVTSNYTLDEVLLSGCTLDEVLLSDCYVTLASTRIATWSLFSNHTFKPRCLGTMNPDPSKPQREFLSIRRIEQKLGGGLTMSNECALNLRGIRGYSGYDLGLLGGGLTGFVWIWMLSRDLPKTSSSSKKHCQIS